MLGRYNRVSHILPPVRKRSSSGFLVKSFTKLSRPPVVYTKNVNNRPPLPQQPEIPQLSKKNSPIIDTDLPTQMNTIPIHRNIFHKDLILPDLKQLPHKINESSMKLFDDKIELCFVRCDFTDPDADKDAKRKKTQNLNDLIQFLSYNTDNELITAKTLEKFIPMISSNLFRYIPTVYMPITIESDQVTIQENCWPHLSLVYRILELVFKHYRNKVLINVGFINQMINLLGSADLNERTQVLNFFLNYADVYPSTRSTLIIKMSYVIGFYLENPKCNPYAISPILQFFLKSFQLNEINSNRKLLTYILKFVILPLIWAPHLPMYFSIITDLCGLYILLEYFVFEDVFSQLVLHWPKSSISKQVVFLQMIFFLLDHVSNIDYDAMYKPLFSLLSRCAASNSSNVVLTSFQIWNNQKTLSIILDSPQDIFPLVYPAIYDAYKTHWNSDVRLNARNVLHQMSTMSPAVLEQQVQNDAIDKKASRSQRGWFLIARTASYMDNTFNLALIMRQIEESLQNQRILDILTQTHNIHKFPFLYSRSCFFENK